MGAPQPTSPASRPGNIALIQRGTCTFREKADNAEAAGAIGVVIFNEGNDGRTRPPASRGTLGQPAVDDPGRRHVASPSARSCANCGHRPDRCDGARRTSIAIDDDARPQNVLADTQTGDADQHGRRRRAPRLRRRRARASTTTAPARRRSSRSPRQMAELGHRAAQPASASPSGAREEVGPARLAATTSTTLTRRASSRTSRSTSTSTWSARRTSSASSTTATARRLGTRRARPARAMIEAVFTDYFAAQGLATEPTAFDGRSDYGAVHRRAASRPAACSPAPRASRRRSRQRSTAAPPASPTTPATTRRATRSTTSTTTALDQMSDAAAHATLAFAMTKSSVNGTDKASNRAKDNMHFKASFARS